MAEFASLVVWCAIRKMFSFVVFCAKFLVELRVFVLTVFIDSCGSVINVLYHVLCILHHVLCVHSFVFLLCFVHFCVFESEGKVCARLVKICSNVLASNFPSK